MYRKIVHIVSGVLVLITVLAPSVECLSAAFYFDVASTGSNTGTSWRDAWKVPRDIIWGGSGVSAGDTLYISGGASSKTYTADSNHWFSVGTSGTSNLDRVVIQIGQDPGHNGIATFDSGGRYHAVLSVSGQSWITIDGEYNGERHIRVYNSRTSSPSKPYALIEINGGTGHLLKAVEIQRSENGVDFLSLSDPGPPYFAAEVVDCYIHDIRQDHALRMQTGGGITRYDVAAVHDTEIQVNNSGTGSSGRGPDAMLIGDGTSVYNCYIHGGIGPVIGGQHQDGIQWVGQSNQGRYYKVYNNTFKDLGNGVMRFDVLEDIGDSVGYFHFYNNVCSLQNPDMDSYHRGIDGTFGNYPSTLYDVVFANNTFVDFDKMGAFVFTVGSEVVVDSLIIKNNLVYNTGSLIEITGGQNCSGAGWDIDYNAINAGKRGGTDVLCNGRRLSQRNLARKVPLFKSYSYRSSMNDFRIRSGDRTALDAGTSMSGYYTGDRDGVKRPQGVAWDIGAYEYTDKGLK